MEAVNPGFYPQPITMEEVGPKNAKVQFVGDGFLTKEEFVTLYNVTCEVPHTQNPWSGKDPKIEFGYKVEEWVARIDRLLRHHTLLLIGGAERWMSR